MRDRILRSIGWLTVRYGVRQAANTGLFFAFALLLTPAEFGTGSIAIAACLLLRQGLERGFRDVVIQRATQEPALSDTAWWAAAASGVLAAGALFLAAPLLARALAQPELTGLLRVCCIVPLVAGLATVQEGRIERAFQQRTLALAQAGASLVSCVLGVSMALGGLGAWAIVLATIVEIFLSALPAFAIARWRPGLAVERRELWRQIRFAWPLMLSALMGGGSFRIAQIAIGAILGPVATAHFRVGMQVHMLLVQLVCAPVIVTLLPSFSKARDRIDRHFPDALSFYALIAFPVFLGAGALLPALLSGLLGPEWSVAADLARIFSLIVFTFVATDVLLPALVAKALPGLAAFVQVSGVLVGLGLMVLGALSGHGLEGAAWGYVLRALYSVPLSVLLARRCLGAPRGMTRQRVGPIALSALVMAGGAAGAVLSSQAAGLGWAWAAVAGLASGVALYTGFLRWGVKHLFPAAYAPFRQHAPERLARLL